MVAGAPWSDWDRAGQRPRPPAGAVGGGARPHRPPPCPTASAWMPTATACIDLPNSTAYVQAGTARPAGPPAARLFVLRLDGGASTATMGGEALPLVSTAGRSPARPAGGGAARGRARSGDRSSRGPLPDRPRGRGRSAVGHGPGPQQFARWWSRTCWSWPSATPMPAGRGTRSGPRTAAGDRRSGPTLPATRTRRRPTRRPIAPPAAWPALAALALERGDPATSVTFVSVAATRAQVTAGLLGPQPGMRAGWRRSTRWRRWWGSGASTCCCCRSGGNDIGFARIVRGLVDADRLADPVCYGTDLQNVWDAAGDGDWNRAPPCASPCPGAWRAGPYRVAGGRCCPGLQGLPAELDRLAEAIAGAARSGGGVSHGVPRPHRGGGAGRRRAARSWATSPRRSASTRSIGPRWRQGATGWCSRSTGSWPRRPPATAGTSSGAWRQRSPRGTGTAAASRRLPGKAGRRGRAGAGGPVRTGAGTGTPPLSTGDRPGERREFRGFAPLPNRWLLQGPADAWETTGTLAPQRAGAAGHGPGVARRLRALVSSAPAGMARANHVGGRQRQRDRLEWSAVDRGT